MLSRPVIPILFFIFIATAASNDTAPPVLTLADIFSTSCLQSSLGSVSCSFSGTLILTSGTTWPVSTMPVLNVILTGSGISSAQVLLQPDSPYILSGNRSLTFQSVTFNAGLSMFDSAPPVITSSEGYFPQLMAGIEIWPGSLLSVQVL